VKSGVVDVRWGRVVEEGEGSTINRSINSCNKFTTTLRCTVLHTTALLSIRMSNYHRTVLYCTVLYVTADTITRGSKKTTVVQLIKHSAAMTVGVVHFKLQVALSPLLICSLLYALHFPS
jgi:hypothetical protein